MILANHQVALGKYETVCMFKSVLRTAFETNISENKQCSLNVISTNTKVFM